MMTIINYRLVNNNRLEQVKPTQMVNNNQHKYQTLLCLTTQSQQQKNRERAYLNTQVMIGEWDLRKVCKLVIKMYYRRLAAIQTIRYKTNRRSPRKDQVIIPSGKELDSSKSRKRFRRVVCSMTINNKRQVATSSACFGSIGQNFLSQLLAPFQQPLKQGMIFHNLWQSPELYHSLFNNKST